MSSFEMFSVTFTITEYVHFGRQWVSLDSSDTSHFRNKPSVAKLLNSNKIKATATGLVEGLYHFSLNITDDKNLFSNDVAFVRVNRSMFCLISY